jgi:hypothetical protein
MVFAGIRVVVTSSDGGKVHPEISWLALWSAIESSVAVSIACMTSFRVLFTQLQNGSSLRNRSRPSAGRVYGYAGSGVRTPAGSNKAWRIAAHDMDACSVEVELEKLGNSHIVETIVEARAPSRSSEQAWEVRASQERILPQESIRVQKVGLMTCTCRSTKTKAADVVRRLGVFKIWDKGLPTNKAIRRSRLALCTLRHWALRCPGHRLGMQFWKSGGSSSQEPGHKRSDQRHLHTTAFVFGCQRIGPCT